MTEETKIIKHEMKEQKHETPITLLRYDEDGLAIFDKQEPINAKHHKKV